MMYKTINNARIRRQTMKKVLTAVLACILSVAAVGFSACGGRGNKSDETTIIKDLVLVRETYGIAGRKEDKAFISEINDALIAISGDGYKSVAEKYGLTSELAITDETTNPLKGATDDSWEKIKASGKIIVGYTVYAPIAYTNEKGEFVGFDTELAKEVVKYLNQKYSFDIKLEFQVITWSAKETNLEQGTIDLIWNGLTITDDRKENMCISVPYLYNNQVAVIRKADEEKYTNDTATFANAVVGAEKGSAGEEVIDAQKLGKEKIPYQSQLEAFNQLKAGSVDIVIIDSVMANFYINASAK